MSEDEHFQAGDRVQVFNPGPLSVGVVLKDSDTASGRTAVRWEGARRVDDYGMPLTQLLRRVGESDA